MTNLERRYRLLLKALPRWYRADREEEMVGLFLESRDPDDLAGEYGWPGWAEAWAILGLAVRTRFATGGAPASAVALGDVTRRTALLGLLIGAVWAGAFFAALGYQMTRPAGQIQVAPWTVVELAPIAALVALALNRRTTAKALAVLMVVVGVFGAVVDLSFDMPALNWAVRLSVLLPTKVVVVALFLGFHRESSAPSTRWLLPVPVLVVAGGALAWFRVSPVLLIAAALVCTAVWRWRDPVTRWAVAVLCVAHLPLANLFLATVPEDWTYVPAIVLLTAGTLMPLLGLRRASVPGSPRP